MVRNIAQRRDKNFQTFSVAIVELALDHLASTFGNDSTENINATDGCF